MKNHFLAFLIIMIAACSCGTQKAATSKRNPKVQTTFFNAHFGESLAFTERKIERDYYIHYTNTRNEREMNNVPFAGREWPYVYISFVESHSYGDRKYSQLFSNIGFVYNSKDKKKAAERFEDVYRLLSEKYPLVRIHSSVQFEKEYAYKDSAGNLVMIGLKRSADEANTWLCMLAYSWGKAKEIEMEKARKDI